MLPLPADILRGVLENLDELVFPQVQDAHGQSVAKCSRMLLKHVILRLEREPQMLVEDSAEKRDVLGAISTRLDTPELTSLRSHVVAALALPIAGPEAGLAAQTASNDALKAAFDEVLRGLDAAEPAVAGDVRELLRSQMRAQMNRELALVYGAFGAEHPF